MEKSCQPKSHLESIEHLELYSPDAEGSYFDPILSKLNNIRILGLSGLWDKPFASISGKGALVSYVTWVKSYANKFSRRCQASLIF